MRLLVLTFILLFAPLASAAQSVEDQITMQLHDQGYAEVTMNRTLLGRLRVVALSEDFERELIVNPKTGQILRDRVTPIDDDGSTQVKILDYDTDDSNSSDEDTSQVDQQTDDKPRPPRPPAGSGNAPQRDGNPAPPRP